MSIPAHIYAIYAGDPMSNYFLRDTWVSIYLITTTSNKISISDV